MPPSGPFLEVPSTLMIKKIMHVFRTSRLLAAAVFCMATDDPRQFAFKVHQRLLQSFLRPVVRHFSFQRILLTVPQRLFSEGNLSELSEYASTEKAKENHRLSRADRHRVIRAQELQEMLTRPVPVAKPNCNVVGNDSFSIPETPRVLFYLTNSLPHTHSGYTYRSHNTLRALRDEGLLVTAMTRLAYPLVVGRWPRQSREEIDGIIYARQLPSIYPATLQQRHSLAVELLVQEAQRTKATVLHTTTDYNNALIVADAADRLGLPWVYEIRGELESTWLSRYPRDKQEELINSDFYRLSRAQENACMKAASAVVALSEVSRQLLIDRGIAEDKITVVPNAIDKADITQDYDKKTLRRELQLPESVIVGTVTSIVGYEGLDTLIKAAAYVPGLYVLIVGDGQARPELESLAVKLGVSERIIFVGRQPNASIWKWYASLDAFVVPRKDTTVCQRVTPIKPLLAQGLGIPVIASDLPALREITGNVATYIPAEDPIELANALRDIIFTSSHATESGIDWAKSHTWEQNARKYCSIYKQIGSGKSE